MPAANKQSSVDKKATNEAAARLHAKVMKLLNEDAPPLKTAREMPEKKAVVSDKHEYLIYGVFGLVSVYLLVSSNTVFACNFVSFIIPAYCSLKAVRTQNKDEETRWLVYWMLFGIFAILNFWSAAIVRVVPAPLYYLLKTGALFYVSLSTTAVAVKKLIKPVPKTPTQIVPLLDKTPVQKQKIKKVSPNAKQPGKQASRKKTTNLELGSYSPPKVMYSDGVPKDIGFGRGDQQQLGGIWLSAKIYIPEIKGYSFIGRILGPRGISVRRLEAETECKILIRGRGSIKDEKREQHLMNRNGWTHLHDKLHVLLLANDETPQSCRERLDKGVQVIQRLLTPQYDEYKRQQLMHLAILNGTYRP